MDDFPSKNQIKQMDEDELREFLLSVHTEINSILKKSTTVENRIEKYKEIGPSASKEYRKLSQNRANLKSSLESAKELLKTSSKLDSEYKEIQKIRKDVQSTLSEIRNKRKEVYRFAEIALEGQKSIKNRLANLEKTFNTNIHRSKSHLSELDKIRRSIATQEQDIEMLQKRIQDLLPGATTATLAFAFREAKKRYGTESVQESMTDEERAQLKEMGWWQNSDKTGFILYGSFVFSLLAIVGWSLYVFVGAEKPAEPLALAMQIIPILPLTWIATHLNRVINLRRKLYEEYNYRERLMILMTGLYEEKEMNQAFLKEDLPRQIITNSIEKPAYIIQKSRDDNPLISVPFPFLRRESNRDLKEQIENVLKEWGLEKT